MDINAAEKALKKAEGVKLTCSTQETVTSLTIEGEWFVNIMTTYEDGDTDTMQMNMSRFVGLYRQQNFTAKNATAPAS